MIQRIFLILMTTIFFQASQAKILIGHEGNGGENVEAFFIKKGKNILTVLSSSNSGNNFLAKHSLNYKALSDTLEASRIETSKQPLKDVNGQEVAAIGEKGRIILSESRWDEYVQNGQDVDQLVFHEMLRSAGVNDDNYRISELISPLSQFFGSEDKFRLSNYIRPEKIQIKVGSKFFEGDTTFVRVNDISRTVEILMPQTFVRSGEIVDYHINISFANLYSQQVKIKEVKYDFAGRLSVASIVRFERAVYNDSSEGTSSFQANAHSLNDLDESGRSFSDSLNLATDSSERLHWKAKLGFQNGPATSRMNLEKIVFSFDF
ncbi:MAG: hypothetical protein ACAH59_10805 [Pseudobdellovibrionaceae bacterium]